MGEVKGPLQTAVELGKGCPLYGRDRLLTFYSSIRDVHRNLNIPGYLTPYTRVEL